MIFNASIFNNHWPTKTLSELGTFNRGKSKHRPRNDKKLFVGGKIPLIQTGDVRQANLIINEHSSNYNEFGLAQSKLWPKGTLCITIAANIAETAMLGYEMCFPDSIVGFNAYEEECSEHFMHYIFSYIRESIQSRIQGSIQDNINIEYLTNLKFKIPEYRERKQITKVLSDLDAKIEVNNKINQELEALAKTIYDYWFVQFDFPDQNGKPYKSSGGKMVYNPELKREIPEGWEVAELGNFIDSNRGVSYSGKDINGEGIPMINLNSFNTDSTYKFEGIKLFSGSYNHSKVLKPLDLVMCNTQQTAINPKTDIIGKSFLVPDIFDSEIVSSHHITTIKVKKDNLKYYLNALFNTEYFHRYISGYATGTNILGLHFAGVSTYKTEIPDDKLLNKFASLIETIEKKKSVIIKENQKLAALRDWLLPMLMNGQATVRSPEEVRDSGLDMVAEETAKYGEG